jgi:hypothetical protein
MEGGEGRLRDPRHRRDQEAEMKAEIGDRLIVLSGVLGRPDRAGDVLEVHGPDGGPPYLIRWSDTGRSSLYFPGPDTRVQAPAGKPAPGADTAH